MNQGIRLFSTFVLAMFAGTKGIELQEQVAKKSLNIIFIGDSITEGEGADAPPVVAAAFLHQQPLVSQVSFSNQGHSGFTTLNFLPSGGETFNEVEQAADSLQKVNPGVLIFSIMLGTNDSAMDGPLGSPVAPADYRKNMMIIIDRLLQDYPGSKIILHRPIWYSPNTYNSSRYLADGLKRLQSYFPEIDTIINTYRHMQPKRVFRGDTAAFGFFKKNYRTYLKPEQGQQGIFYLHPDKAGAKMLARFWSSAISRTIDKF